MTHRSELAWNFRVAASRLFYKTFKQQFYALMYSSYQAKLEYIDFERAYMMGDEL